MSDTGPRTVLAEVRARTDAATPGPWEADGWEIHAEPGHVWVAESCDLDAKDGGAANAAFIAHAREDVPFLLAELARRDAALEAVLEVAHRWDHVAAGRHIREAVAAALAAEAQR